MVSVVTTMVTKVTISCLNLAWLRQFLRHSANHGGSTETVNLFTNMRLIHALLIPKEVHTLMVDAHTLLMDGSSNENPYWSDQNTQNTTEGTIK